MSQNERRTEISDRRNYRIDIGAYGSIAIEAPTKDECLELFKEVTPNQTALRNRRSNTVIFGSYIIQLPVLTQLFWFFDSDAGDRKDFSFLQLIIKFVKSNNHHIPFVSICY